MLVLRASKGCSNGRLTTDRIDPIIAERTSISVLVYPLSLSLWFII